MGTPLHIRPHHRARRAPARLSLPVPESREEFRRDTGPHVVASSVTATPSRNAGAFGARSRSFGTSTTEGLRPPPGQSTSPGNHINSGTPQGSTKTQQKNHRRTQHRVGPTGRKRPSHVFRCFIKLSVFRAQRRRDRTATESPAMNAKQHTKKNADSWIAHSRDVTH